MENEPINKIQEIHDKLEQLLEQRVKVRANMGRSRIVEREGVILQVHPALFVMEVDEKRGRKARHSYQFVDVLTGTVELYDLLTSEPYFEIVTEQ